MFGDRAEVLFNRHYRPEWAGEYVVAFLNVQRDTYKYIHDQTLRLANAGYMPGEIAEQLNLPPSLQRTFHNRGTTGLSVTMPGPSTSDILAGMTVTRPTT